MTGGIAVLVRGRQRALDILVRGEVSGRPGPVTG